MIKYYQGLDLFLHLGSATGTPNPLFEAAACGVPGISTSIGAAPELIKPEHNGYLMPRYYTKEEGLTVAKNIADRILYLERNRDIVCYMRKQARAEIENSWTWEQRSLAFHEMFQRHRKAI